MLPDKTYVEGTSPAECNAAAPIDYSLAQGPGFGEKLETGAIVGISIGAVCAAIALAFFAYTNGVKTTKLKYESMRPMLTEMTGGKNAAVSAV